MPKKEDKITIHSSAAEYHTYVAAVGDSADRMEMFDTKWIDIFLKKQEHRKMIMANG